MEEFINGLEAYLKGSILLSFVASFLGGVLASFTPCVYPMIPITAGVVGGRNIGGSRLKGLVFSLVYVLGMAVTYAAMGVIAVVTGSFFGSIGSNPWAYFVVANVIIALGLGMLDVFPIPTFQWSSGSEGRAGLLGIFLLGILSGIVVGPCTAPVVGVLLAYAATTGNVVYGALLLFTFALGMGVLLIVVGTFSGVLASLPRSGEWMIKIKKALGILMIGLGEYFLIEMGRLMF